MTKSIGYTRLVSNYQITRPPTLFYQAKLFINVVYEQVTIPIHKSSFFASVRALLFIWASTTVNNIYIPNNMAASFLPSVLVPLVGLVFPAIAMASLFLYIEKEEVV